MPAEHTQRAEGVPSAWPAFALVHLDRHPAGVLRLERPSAAGVALRHDQIDGFGHAGVWPDPSAAEVLEAPQHVVVPPRRKSEAGPHRVALAISRDHLAR